MRDGRGRLEELLFIVSGFQDERLSSVSKEEDKRRIETWKFLHIFIRQIHCCYHSFVLCEINDIFYAMNYRLHMRLYYEYVAFMR